MNVHGVAFGIKHAGRVLAEGGRVINMASFVGLIATPRGTAYSTSKAAVIHLTRLGAIELAPRHITVNAISPGTIRTPAVTDIPNNPEIPFIERRTPLGRLGEPGEVAALAHFLASRTQAAYITGQNIAIDGGLTAGWTEYDLVPPANVQRWKVGPMTHATLARGPRAWSRYMTATPWMITISAPVNITMGGATPGRQVRQRHRTAGASRRGRGHLPWDACR